MIITQLGPTWYLYMSTKIDYSEPSSKLLINGIYTDTACRAACDYSSGCNSYILQTDRATTFTSCYSVVEPLSVYIDRVIHPEVRDIIIGIKTATITPTNYSPTTYLNQLKIPLKSFQTCTSIGHNISPASEFAPDSSCLNIALLPKKINRFKLGINGGFCSIKLILTPFSCDSSFLKATSCVFGQGLYKDACLVCPKEFPVSNPVGPCTKS